MSNSKFGTSGGNSGSTSNNKSTSASGSTGGGSGSLGVTSSSETGSRPGEGVLAVLEKFGVDEGVVNSLMTQWRGQLSEKVSQKIQDGDLVELLDGARDMAKNSGEKIKAYAQSNPAMFYSGVAAILTGAGLLAAAARGEGSTDTTSGTGNNDRGL